MRYDQHGNNKVCGRKPNSATISKHVESTAPIAACFVRMVPPKRAHDGTSAPPAAPGASWGTEVAKRKLLVWSDDETDEI